MEPEDIVSEPVWKSESWVKVKVRARVYDSSYRVEPEDMVSEPEDMTAVTGWNQWIICQSHILWQELWGGASGYGVGASGYGSLVLEVWSCDFSVSPNPFVLNFGTLNLVLTIYDCTSAHKVYKLVLMLCIQYKDKHNLIWVQQTELFQFLHSVNFTFKSSKIYSCFLLSSTNLFHQQNLQLLCKFYHGKYNTWDPPPSHPQCNITRMGWCPWTG